MSVLRFLCPIVADSFRSLNHQIRRVSALAISYIEHKHNELSELEAANRFLVMPLLDRSHSQFSFVILGISAQF